MPGGAPSKKLALLALSEALVSLAAINKTVLATTSYETTYYDLPGLYS